MNLFAHYVSGINPPNIYQYKTALESFNSAIEKEIFWENPFNYEKTHEETVRDELCQCRYITNTELEPNLVIEHYNNLWYIEKAFRMSKTDLRIRPIYHRVRRRIEAHICISFTAYCIYKELERVLKEEKIDISIVNAVELTYNMFELTYTVPETNRLIKKLLQMDEKQAELYKIIEKHY